MAFSEMAFGNTALLPFQEEIGEDCKNFAAMVAIESHSRRHSRDPPSDFQPPVAQGRVVPRTV